MGTWFATSVTDFAPLNLLTLFEYIQFRIHAHSNIIFCYTLSHWEKLTTTWNEWKHSHTIVLSHPNQSLILSHLSNHITFSLPFAYTYYFFFLYFLVLLHHTVRSFFHFKVVFILFVHFTTTTTLKWMIILVFSVSKAIALLPSSRYIFIVIYTFKNMYWFSLFFFHFFFF